jgi:hypothetical protein
VGPQAAPLAPDHFCGDLEQRHQLDLADRLRAALAQRIHNPQTGRVRQRFDDGDQLRFSPSVQVGLNQCLAETADPPRAA